MRHPRGKRERPIVGQVRSHCLERVGQACRVTAREGGVWNTGPRASQRDKPTRDSLMYWEWGAGVGSVRWKVTRTRPAVGRWRNRLGAYAINGGKSFARGGVGQKIG